MTLKWENLLSPIRIRHLLADDLSKRDPLDHRSHFDSDYDRAVFSTPLRRLQDKAQVFPLEPNDSVRTRLTHSLEVSTVSRDISRAVAKWLREDRKVVDVEQALDIETIAATCGLIHDLGNPPFGHSGEEAIRDWFRVNQNKWKLFSDDEMRTFKNDFLLFEGNAQTLRLISKLQMLTDFHGLNLTTATMSAACKYTASSNHLSKNIHERSKVGYFASEEKLIDLVRAQTGTGEARNPITYLVEAADDIVYSIIDIEDAIKKKVLSWERLKSILKKLQLSKIDELIKKSEGKVNECGIQMEESFREEAFIQWFRVFVFRECVSAVIESLQGKLRINDAMRVSR